MGDAIKEAITTPKPLRLILPHHKMGGTISRINHCIICRGGFGG